MIYLDNAATGGFKPQSVQRAVSSAIAVCANAGRSGHALSVQGMQRITACRQLLNDFFHGYGLERVVFTKNATEALDIVLFGTLQKGDHVVTTVAEHNSVLRPLHYLQNQGVVVDYAPLDEKGCLSVANIASLVKSNTKAVVITLASNVTGTYLSIPALRQVLPQQTWLICDGAQACGHVAVDMQAWGIDALAVAGHKGMLAMQGSGVLLFSTRLQPNPFMFGGTGSDSLNPEMPMFYPDRLEAGTLNYPAICSLAEGVLYLNSHLSSMKKKVEDLTNQLIAGLSSLVQVYSEPNPFGIVAFDLPHLSSEQVATVLSDDYGIAVRGGWHCAPLMHRALGTTGLVRASVSSFNTAREVWQLCRAVEQIVRRQV